MLHVPDGSRGTWVCTPQCCGRVLVPSPLCMPGARCSSPCRGVLGADSAALCLLQVWAPARQQEEARGRCR